MAVTATAVVLRPVQQANLDAARGSRLALMLAELPGLAGFVQQNNADTLETVLIDLQSGTQATGISMAEFDFLAAQTDPARSTVLAPEADIATIGRRPNTAPIYLLRDGEQLALVVLPVYGTGYQSVIRAYLALGPDLETIAGLSIYEQGETPGIGSRIADPAWQAQWTGVQSRSEGDVVVSMVMGGGSGPNQVDGLSGATRSSRSVGQMVQFWLGENGFGPFLTKLQQEGGT